ncbi:MAG: hypothetical protein Q9166_003685 [cf. Caloplaca sp. 2 TL-2023]
MAKKLQSSISGPHDPVFDRTQATGDLKALLAEIHHNLGCIGTETNDPIGTLKNFQTFNELMNNEFGDGTQGKDKRLAISWNELGNAYMLNGLWAKGEESFKKSMQTMQRVDGFQNIDNSFALVNLGLAYWLTDRLQEAVDVLMEGLKHREALYGPDDRESFITGRFLHALGNVKAAQGLRQESQKYHNRALAQYLSTIGQNHHRTGDLHVKVAEHHYQLQEYEEALYHLDLALKIFVPRPLLKPEKARAKFIRSLIYKDIGRLDDAVTEAEESTRLYCEIRRVRRDDIKDLTEEDFAGMIAFWSR